MPRSVKKNRSPRSASPIPSARPFDRGLFLALLLLLALPAAYGHYFPCGLGLLSSKHAYWECQSQTDNAKYQYELGKLYYQGEAVPQDLRRARILLSRAARQGHAAAQNALGVLFHNFYDIESQQTALAWFRAAAAQGNHLAQYHLGEYYYEGIGVPQDYLTSAYWYEQAATAGYHPAPV